MSSTLIDPNDIPGKACPFHNMTQSFREALRKDWESVTDDTPAPKKEDGAK